MSFRLICHFCCDDSKETATRYRCSNCQTKICGHSCFQKSDNIHNINTTCIGAKIEFNPSFFIKEKIENESNWSWEIPISQKIGHDSQNVIYVIIHKGNDIKKSEEEEDLSDDLPESESSHDSLVEEKEAYDSDDDNNDKEKDDAKNSSDSGSDSSDSSKYEDILPVEKPKKYKEPGIQELEEQIDYSPSPYFGHDDSNYIVYVLVPTHILQNVVNEDAKIGSHKNARKLRRRIKKYIKKNIAPDISKIDIRSIQDLGYFKSEILKKYKNISKSEWRLLLKSLLDNDYNLSHQNREYYTQFEYAMLKEQMLRAGLIHQAAYTERQWNKFNNPVRPEEINNAQLFILREVVQKYRSGKVKKELKSTPVYTFNQTTKFLLSRSDRANDHVIKKDRPLDYDDILRKLNIRYYDWESAQLTNKSQFDAFHTDGFSDPTNRWITINTADIVAKRSSYESTFFHEVAHVLMQHLDKTMKASVKEIEAEGVSIVCLVALSPLFKGNKLEKYIKRTVNYFSRYGNELSKKSIQNIFDTSQKIMDAVFSDPLPPLPPTQSNNNSSSNDQNNQTFDYSAFLNEPEEEEPIQDETEETFRDEIRAFQDENERYADSGSLNDDATTTTTNADDSLQRQWIEQTVDEGYEYPTNAPGFNTSQLQADKYKPRAKSPEYKPLDYSYLPQSPSSLLNASEEYSQTSPRYDPTSPDDSFYPPPSTPEYIPSSPKRYDPTSPEGEEGPMYAPATPEPPSSPRGYDPTSPEEEAPFYAPESPENVGPNSPTYTPTSPAFSPVRIRPDSPAFDRDAPKADLPTPSSPYYYPTQLPERNPPTSEPSVEDQEMIEQQGEEGVSESRRRGKKRKGDEEKNNEPNNSSMNGDKSSPPNNDNKDEERKSKRLRTTCKMCNAKFIPKSKNHTFCRNECNVMYNHYYH